MKVPISRALADRAALADDLVASGPVVNMRFPHGKKALSLRAGKLFHLLVKHAGAELTADVEHTMRLADLWRIAHLNSSEIIDVIRELQTTLVEVEVTLDSPGKDGAPLRLATVSGPMLDYVERAHDDTGNLVFSFSKTMRLVMAHSDHWAVISRRAVLAFESRYSLRLYEIVALRKGLAHKVSETFELDDLRLRLGVPVGTHVKWFDFRRKILDGAVAEINHITGFTVSYAPIKRGRPVAAVKLSWREKDAAGRKAAQRELEASRVGRRARRLGAVETVVEPPAGVSPAHGKAAGFPADGTIAYGPWAELVRQHAPAPTPDVDRVANAFRGWAAKQGIPLGGASIEKSFVTFCKGFRGRR